MFILQVTCISVFILQTVSVRKQSTQSHYKNTEPDPNVKMFSKHTSDNGQYQTQYCYNELTIILNLYRIYSYINYIPEQLSWNVPGPTH